MTDALGSMAAEGVRPAEQCQRRVAVTESVR